MIDAWDLGVQWAEAESGSQLELESLSGQRRSFFANMFERAANLARGGSLTMLVLVDTPAFAAVGPSAVGSIFSTLNDCANGGAESYNLSDFEGRKESELERIRRLLDRGVTLTDKTLEAIGISPPARASTS